MKKIIENIKKKVKSWGFDDDASEEVEEEYLELDASGKKGSSSKVLVRPFILQDFSDIKEVVDSLREGYTIALVNIKALKEKDMVELRRAVNKLKKTCDALGGDIAGFGDEYIIATPNFAEIYRAKDSGTSEVKESSEKK